MPKTSLYTLPRIENLVGRGLLGTVTVAAAACETALNWQAAAGDGFGAVGMVQLSLPWIALAVVLGMEHSHTAMTAVHRVGMWVCVSLVVVVVLLNSMHRTAGAQDADMQASVQSSGHAADLRSQRDAKRQDAKALKDKAEAETVKSGCGPICRDWLKQAGDAERQAADLELDASQFGTSASSLALAHQATALHIDVKILALYKPLLGPIALQILVLLCGSIAFAPGRRVRVPGKMAFPISQKSVPPEATLDAIEEACRYLTALLAQGGKVESLTALATTMGTHRSTIHRASKRLEAQGLLRRHQDGRRVTLTAA